MGWKYQLRVQYKFEPKHYERPKTLTYWNPPKQNWQTSNKLFQVDRRQIEIEKVYWARFYILWHFDEDSLAKLYPQALQ